MLDVHVDLTALEPLIASLSEDAVQSILEDIAESARNHWLGLAGSAFHTTRRDYIAGIQPVEMKPGMAVIALVGVLPNLLENGMDEQDLRDTLLGPNVPVAPFGQRGKRLSAGKDGSIGYYRAIPFRHSTPGSSGTIAPAMGSAYQGHAAVADYAKLGAAVYGKAKKLAGTTSMPGGGVAYGGRLKSGLAPKLRSHHKTDIYAGMIRSRKKYERETQSQYSTFRTISTRVTTGWIRPATPGSHLAEKVGDFVGSLAPQAFAAYVSSLK